MFAKNLESLLTELCQKGDVSYASNKEIATRFDALRGFGQLPRGRVHRATPLTNAQIAAAIFGLASELPNWAGHAAVILSKLQPVGGPDAAFYGTASLQNAVEKILCDNDARKSVINLSVSVSESAINSNGFATLSYDDNGTRSRAFFVPRQALSLLRQGAETHFDAERRYAEVSRQISFSRKFFNRIAQAVQRARSLPCLPAGDGSEYDAEEAQAERYRKLRVNGRSNFLSIGVDNQVTWPMEETVVEFDRYHLVLMPKTRDHVQSVHIDLHANRLSDLDAMTVVNRFLSMMTWCDDQYAVAQGGTSGSPETV